VAGRVQSGWQSDHHQQDNMADMVQKRRARLERATADRRGEADGPFQHADPEERLHAANVASSTEK